MLSIGGYYMSTSELSAQHNLVDEITYLATLVSDPHAIDPTLDQLRQITSSLGSGQDPSEAQTQILLQVRQSIQEYIIKRETLRLFTPESLQQQVYEHFEGQRKIHRLHRLLGVIAGVIFVCVAAIVVLPFDLEPAMREELAIVSVLTLLHLGGGGLFVASPKTFPPVLRRAYLLAAIGLCLVGIALLQEPLLILLNQTDSTWEKIGGTIAPYTIAYALIYYGTRSMARLLKLQDFAASPRVIGLALALAAVAAVAAPHAHADMPEVSFDLIAALTLMFAVLAGFSARLTYRMWRATTPLYAAAMKWFFWGLAVTAYAGLQFFVGRLVVGDVEGESAVVILAPFIISAVLLFKAGYGISRLARQ